MQLTLATACSIASFDNEELGVAIDEASLPVHIRDRMASAAKQATANTQTQETAVQMAASAGSVQKATSEQVHICAGMYALHSSCVLICTTLPHPVYHAES